MDQVKEKIPAIGFFFFFSADLPCFAFVLLVLLLLNANFMHVVSEDSPCGLKNNHAR